MFGILVFIRTSFLQYFFCHEAWEFIIHHHHFTLVAGKWSWVFSGHFSMLTFPSLGRKPSGTYPMIMLILWNEYGSFPKKTAVIFICLWWWCDAMILEINSGISQLVKIWKKCHPGITCHGTFSQDLVVEFFLVICQPLIVNTFVLHFFPFWKHCGGINASNHH